MCARVCVWERERKKERETGSHSGISCLNRPWLVYCRHIGASSLSVTRLCSPFGLELMVKLRTLLTVFTFILKDEARDYGKGHTFPTSACGARPITMHWVSWPIRADCACQKEGLCRKQCWHFHFQMLYVCECVYVDKCIHVVMLYVSYIYVCYICVF